ncbi:MAG: polyphenol oxidase family protein [Vicinamibacterales bacterium]
MTADTRDIILPHPGPGFEWRETPVAPALVCLPLETIASHLFTTRGFLLGETRTGDAPWQQVATVLGGAPLVRLRQVHGATVVIATTEIPDEPLEGDVVVAAPGGPAIVVQGADCVPLLVADRRLGVVAAAHAGWRGLALDVPLLVVDALRERFGSRPDDLVAAIGPSIGACCYEVGPDVVDAFRSGSFGVGSSAWFHDMPQPTRTNRSMPGVGEAARAGHAYFDGWSCATAQLEAAGLPAESIHCARLCTASHPTLLCSYRRDRSSAGRIAGAIVPAR